MKKNLTIIILFVIQLCFSQATSNKTKGFKITYLKSSNGKIIDNQDPILVFSTPVESLITTNGIHTNKATFPFEETIVIPSDNQYWQVATLDKTKKVSTIDSLSLAKQKFETTSDTKIILGYKCHKATTIINSNTIDVWYTNDLNSKGAPTVLGQKLGLVLEMVRNNNYVISATKIEKVKIPNLSKQVKTSLKNKPVDVLTYRDILWKSRFTTLKVFENEVINFSDTSRSNDSILCFANGTVLLKKIKFPTIKPGSRIFIDINEQSNGDAYDRTGSAFIIPTQQKQSFMDGLINGANTLPQYSNGNGKTYQGVVATENYFPLIELMRFFTPFGIKQYNYLELKDKNWHEVVPYRQDISEFRSVMSNQDIWVGTFISNYDKGGHKISMNITIHDEENATSKNNFVLPLFNTTNVMEMAGQDYPTMFNTDKGLEVSFTLEKEVKNATLRYITTGHGGWENGDEYLQKKNTIYLDNKEIYSFIPWRTDCGTYRLFNPASGNFPNGLSSSDYSRSNWCPGTVTNPTYINLGDLKAGEHTIRVHIPQGAPEGNSFSAWNVSGVLIGE